MGSLKTKGKGKVRYTSIMAVAMAFSCACPAGEVLKFHTITDPVYTRPATLVDIGHGQRLNLYCLGSGSPAVIFDAGLGDSTIAWALVQPAISKKTMTCSFDRAGLGFSDAARRPSTAANQAEDLHALLQVAHIKPPYILVGHSMAGMNVRVYADKYRDEVVGMVIVDGSHEDQTQRFRGTEPAKSAYFKQEDDAYHQKLGKCVGYAEKGLVAGTPEFKLCVGDFGLPDSRFSAAINAAQEKYAITPKWQAANVSEEENFSAASADEARATRKDFGDMPIFVLTHSPRPKKKDEPQDVRDRRVLIWEELHSEVAAMSTRGVNIIVPGSQHYIQFDHPQVVVDTVLEAVDIARGQ
jgi:pimeloyl-ACP methyl ester carboxylesterase